MSNKCLSIRDQPFTYIGLRACGLDALFGQNRFLVCESARNVFININKGHKAW
jgi:hypothetical protein